MFGMSVYLYPKLEEQDVLYYNFVLLFPSAVVYLVLSVLEVT